MQDWRAVVRFGFSLALIFPVFFFLLFSAWLLTSKHRLQCNTGERNWIRERILSISLLASADFYIILNAQSCCRSLPCVIWVFMVESSDSFKGWDFPGVCSCDWTYWGRSPQHDPYICYERPPPLTDDAMTGVRPTLSNGMFTWQARCCLWRQELRFKFRKKTTSFRPNKKQHEWLSSIFCLFKAVICVSHFTVSVINAFDLDWGKTQSAFSLLMFRDCWSSLEDKSWSVLFFSPDPSRSVIYVTPCTNTHAHTCTDTCSRSSQWGAKVPFPCVFRLCF